MKYNELSTEAKYHALLWFNSEYDGYGINKTKEYKPYNLLKFKNTQNNFY